MSNTDQETLTATAINWAEAHPHLGIPNDFTEADARLLIRPIRHRMPESSMAGANELNLDYNEWTVELRNQWLVDLDGQGFPKGAPRPVR
jgi:hypothetical protein